MTRRERIVVITCALLAALILLGYFWILPAARKAKEQETGMAEMTERQRIFARTLAEGELADKRLSHDQALLNSLEKRFIGDTDGRKGTVALLRLIEDLARRAGVSLKSKDIVGTETRDGVIWASVSVTAESSSAALVRLLYAIGHHDQCLSVRGLEISSSPDSPVLSARVVVTAALPFSAGGDGK